jgi:hypothetical protein
MKNKLINYFLILSVASCFTACNGSGSGSSGSRDTARADSTSDTVGIFISTANFACEYNLDISFVGVSLAVRDAEHNAFKTNFKNAALTNFAAYSENVKYSELENKIFKSQTGVCGRYISGLRVFYTIDNSNRLKFYYSPENATTAALSPDPISFSFPINNSGGTNELDYILNNTSLTVFESDGYGNLVDTRSSSALKTAAISNLNRYESDLKIVSNTSPLTYRNFNPLSPVFDAASIYFPFKEIYQLYVDNSNPRDIVFLSTTKKNPSYPTTSDLKHYITLHTSPTTTTAANYGMICPNNCGPFKVAMRRIVGIL